MTESPPFKNIARDTAGFTWAPLTPPINKMMTVRVAPITKAFPVARMLNTSRKAPRNSESTGRTFILLIRLKN